MNRHVRALLAVGSRRTPAFEPPEVARLRERVAELEALLVQAEDYAREQADDAAEVEQLCDGIASLFQGLWPVGPLTWINADALRTATERAVALVAAEAAVQRVRAELDYHLCRCPAPTTLGHCAWCPGVLMPVAVVRRAIDAATPPAPDAAAPDA